MNVAVEERAAKKPASALELAEGLQLQGKVSNISDHTNSKGRLEESWRPPIGELASGSANTTAAGSKPKMLKSILKQTIKGRKINTNNSVEGKQEEESSLSPGLYGSVSNLIQTTEDSQWSESAIGSNSIGADTGGSHQHLVELPSASPNLKEKTLEEGEQKEQIATSKKVPLALRPRAIMSLKEEAGATTSINNNNKKQISGVGLKAKIPMLSSSGQTSASNRQAGLVSGPRSLLTDSHLSSWYNSNVGNQAEFDWHSNDSQQQQDSTVARRRSLVRFSDIKSVFELSPTESSCSSDNGK